MDWYKIGISAGTALGITVVMVDKKIKPDKKLKYSAIIAGCGIGGLVGRDQYQKWRSRKDVEEHGESITDTGVNLTQTAMEIYDAFYNNDWMGITEDETAAVNAVLRVPKENIAQLALIYNRKYDENLYEDFRKFLGTEYNKVQHLLQ